MGDYFFHTVRMTAALLFLSRVVFGLLFRSHLLLPPLALGYNFNREMFPALFVQREFYQTASASTEGVSEVVPFFDSSGLDC